MWHCLNTTRVTVQALSIVTAATARQLLVSAVSVRLRTMMQKNDTSKRMPNVGSGQYSPEVHWREQKLWPEMHSCRKAPLVFFRLPFDVGLWKYVVSANRGGGALLTSSVCVHHETKQKSFKRCSNSKKKKEMSEATCWVSGNEVRWPSPGAARARTCNRQWSHWL